MADSQWRTASINVIAKALVFYQDNHSAEVVPHWLEFAKWCSLERYPFHQRQYMPYKIWCQEIQRVRIFLKNWCTVQSVRDHGLEMVYRSWRAGYKPVPPNGAAAKSNNPDQTSLF